MAQPSAQSLHQGEISQALTPLVRATRTGRLGDGRIEGGGRLIEVARPEFDRSAAEFHLGVNLRLPGAMASEDLLQQGPGSGRRSYGRIEISDTAGNGQPELRGG